VLTLSLPRLQRVGLKAGAWSPWLYPKLVARRADGAVGDSPRCCDLERRIGPVEARQAGMRQQFSGGSRRYPTKR
jgi:hypothetical protein